MYNLSSVGQPHNGHTWDTGGGRRLPLHSSSPSGRHAFDRKRRTHLLTTLLEVMEDLSAEGQWVNVLRKKFFFSKCSEIIQPMQTFHCNLTLDLYNWPRNLYLREKNLDKENIKKLLLHFAKFWGENSVYTDKFSISGRSANALLQLFGAT